jgi:hypothetical protein
MNSSIGLTMFFSQTVAAAPLLLVYVVGMVLAARWWRRAPRAAMLALSGFALLLLATIGGSAVQALLVASAPAGALASMAIKMQVYFFAFTVVRAIGTGLVVAAVFAGRPRDRSGGFDVQGVDPAVPMAGLAPERSRAI